MAREAANLLNREPQAREPAVSELITLPIGHPPCHELAPYKRCSGTTKHDRNRTTSLYPRPSASARFWKNQVLVNACGVDVAFGCTPPHRFSPSPPFPQISALDRWLNKSFV